MFVVEEDGWVRSVRALGSSIAAGHEGGRDGDVVVVAADRLDPNPEPGPLGAGGQRRAADCWQRCPIKDSWIGVSLLPLPIAPAGGNC